MECLCWWSAGACVPIFTLPVLEHVSLISVLIPPGSADRSHSARLWVGPVRRHPFVTELVISGCVLKAQVDTLVRELVREIISHPPSPEYSLRRFKLRTNFCDWRSKQPNFFFVTCFSSWPSFLLFIINSRCFSFPSFTSQSVFSGRSRAIPVWVILFKRNLEMTFILISHFFNSFLICNTLC